MVVPQIFVQMEIVNVMDQIYLFQYFKSATDMENKCYLDTNSGLNRYNNGDAGFLCFCFFNQYISQF